MKIAFLSQYDTRNIHSYSGTGYFLPKALENLGIQVERIDALPRFALGSRLLSRIMAKLFHSTISADRTLRSVYLTSKSAQNRLQNINYDAIVTTQYSTVTFLQTSKPIFFWNDAAYAQLLGYYFPNPNPIHKSEIKFFEKRAFYKARALAFTSEWALKEAQACYNLPEECLRIIPYGLNIESPQSNPSFKNLSNQSIRLLAVGVQWERKGYDLACEFAEKLRQSGLRCILDIVGCYPPSPLPQHNTDTIFHGFLSKSNPEHAKRLEELYQGAHFYLLPSRADFSPMVIAEANSYSLPVIATDAGGISTLIGDQGGVVFPINTWIDSSVRFINNIVNNQEKYNQMRLNAFNNFSNNLTWNCVSRKFEDLIRNSILSSRTNQ